MLEAYLRVGRFLGQGWLLAVVMLALAWAALIPVAVVQVEGEVFSALAAGDSSRVTRWLIFLGLGLLAKALAETLGEYLLARLQLAWRARLTRRLLRGYLARRAYYRLPLEHPELDNPDQRLAQDVETLANLSLELLQVAVTAAVGSAARVAVLWSLSGWLLAGLLFYALAGNLLALLTFGRRLSRLDVERFRREGDLRYALKRLLEQAESIAFYRGEGRELEVLERRLGWLKGVLMQRLVWLQGAFGAFRVVYDRVPEVLALAVLVPRVAAGRLEVGQLFAAARHARDLEKALNSLLAALGTLTALNAAVRRVAELEAGLSLAAVTPPLTGPELKAEDLTVTTPAGRVLLRQLNFRLESGKRLLVSGPSGCGKSSLLRVLAGLWPVRQGRLTCPEGMQFVPQRGYLFRGTLREQLLSPEASDQELRTALHRAQLATLLDRVGLDQVVDFPRVLSGGEAQRLALARVFLGSPGLLLLDEATSALDQATEERLYEELVATGAALVSVAHRPSLARFHTCQLELGSCPGPDDRS